MSASGWVGHFTYFLWGDKWCRNHCKPVILALMLFVPSKLLNCYCPIQYPCHKKFWWFFSFIWAALLFLLIWTIPKNSSLTLWESLSLYLTKVVNSALWEISVSSSVNILQSDVVIRCDKRPSLRWSLIQVRYSSTAVLEMYVAWLLL